MRTTETITDEAQAELLGHFADDYNDLVAFGKRAGVDMLNALLDTFGGQKPHVPSRENFWASLMREVRNEQIRMQFHGNNLGEISQDTGLAERQLRHIVAREPKRYMPKMEPTRPVQVSPEKHGALTSLAARHGVPVRQVADILLDLALEDEAIEQRLADRLPQLQLVMPAA